MAANDRCTCTIACIPQGLVGDQVCRLRAESEDPTAACRHGVLASVNGEHDGHRLWRCGRCKALVIWPDTQRDPVVVEAKTDA